VLDPEARTTLAFVSLAANGERDFVFYRNPGADQRYAVHDIDEKLVRDADIFHFGSISMTGEPARSATLHAAALAKKSGRLVSFDPNVRRNLWPDDAALSRAIAPKQGDDFAFAHIEVEAVQHVALIVPAIEVADLKHGRCRDRRPPSPPRATRHSAHRESRS